VVLVAAGVVVLVQAFVRFVAEGVGTPAPVAPTQRLVVGGLYRYVRNPMYLAVVTTIVGQALVLAQPVLLGYALAVGAAMAAFVHGYEEPTPARQFGEQYQATGGPCRPGGRADTRGSRVMRPTNRQPDSYGRSRHPTHQRRPARKQDPGACCTSPVSSMQSVPRPAVGPLHPDLTVPGGRQPGCYHAGPAPDSACLEEDATSGLCTGAEARSFVASTGGPGRHGAGLAGQDDEDLAGGDAVGVLIRSRLSRKISGQRLALQTPDRLSYVDQNAGHRVRSPLGWRGTGPIGARLNHMPRIGLAP
jgi:hypothetical protein